MEKPYSETAGNIQKQLLMADCPTYEEAVHATIFASILSEPHWLGIRR